MDDLVAYLDGPSVMRLKGDLVFVEDRSGQRVLARVMSIHDLMANHETARRVIAEWREGQDNVYPLRREGA